jgi:hypothetical protein
MNHCNLHTVSLAWQELLELSERIGSVKEERWAVKAEAEIQKLSFRKINSSEVNGCDRYRLKTRKPLKK